MRKVVGYLMTPTAVFLIIGIAVALFFGLTRRHHQEIAAQQRAARCRTDQKLAQRPVTHGKPTVAVLGDGLADGYGLPHTMTQAWPALLGTREHWTTIVNGDARSGFVASGFCGHERFATRVGQVLAAHPALVIVEGGTSDVAQASAVGERNFDKPFRVAAKHVLRRLARVPHLVEVGPLPDQQPPSSIARHLDSELAQAAAASGTHYISALHWKLPKIPHADQGDTRSEAAIAAYLERSLPSFR